MASSAAHFDQLPAVTRWVAKTGVHFSVTANGLLSKLNAYGMHALVGGAAVVHNEYQRRHRAFCHNRVQRLRGRLVMHRRTRFEEAELQQGLVRVLQGEPAIVAVAHIGVDPESELLLASERLVNLKESFAASPLYM